MPPTLLSTTPNVFDGGFFTITKKDYQLSNKKLRTSYIINQKDTVVIFALTPTSKVVLVEQFRYGPDSITIELPSGGIEPGEDPHQAAIRELQEESGYVGELEYIGKVMNNPGSTQTRHVFVCKDATELTIPTPEDLETIKVKEVSIEEFKELIFKGKTLSTDAAIMALSYLGLVR